MEGASSNSSHISPRNSGLPSNGNRRQLPSGHNDPPIGNHQNDPSSETNNWRPWSSARGSSHAVLGFMPSSSSETNEEMDRSRQFDDDMPSTRPEELAFAMGKDVMRDHKCDIDSVHHEADGGKDTSQLSTMNKRPHDKARYPSGTSGNQECPSGVSLHNQKRHQEPCDPDNDLWQHQKRQKTSNEVCDCEIESNKKQILLCGIYMLLFDFD